MLLEPSRTITTSMYVGQPGGRGRVVGKEAKGLGRGELLGEDAQFRHGLGISSKSASLSK